MSLEPSSKISAESPRRSTVPFVVTVILLGASALLFFPPFGVSNWVNLRLEKMPLPLKASLATMNESALMPYRVVKRHVLDEAVHESLGTDEYILWTLEDTSVAVGSRVRHVELLVTYYTGGTRLIVHRPEACYLGAGYQPSQLPETREIDVPSLDDVLSPVPVRLCSFIKTVVRHHEKTNVLYTLFANDQFSADSRRVRALINYPRNRYAYFSKVEATFPHARREESVEATQKLLDVVLPILIADHWPDFAAAEKDAEHQASKAE